MFLEPILAFFLIRNLRKKMRTFSPDEKWNRYLTISLYAVAALLVLNVVFSHHPATLWFWHFVLVIIIAVTFKLPQFAAARPATIAVLPLIILSILSEIFKEINEKFYNAI